MSAWAYRCHPPDEGSTDWFVSQLDVEKLGPDVQIVRVKVGADWKCALLDRTQTVTVEDQLLGDVIASDEEDCPQCAEMLAATVKHGEMRQTKTAPSQNSIDVSSDARRFAPELHEHSKGDYSYQQHANFSPATNGKGLLDRLLSAVAISNNDLCEAAFSVMIAAMKDMDDDIRMIMAEIKAMTAAKQKFRELIKALNQWISEEMSKHHEVKDITNEEVTGESPDEKFLVSETKIEYNEPRPAPGNEGFVGEIATYYDVCGGRVTIQTLQSLLRDLKGKLDGMSELNETMSLRLQIAVEKRYRIIAILSRILEKINAEPAVPYFR